MEESNHILVPDGVYIVSETDEKGIIRDVNDHFLAITGYSTDEVIGKPHNIIRHPHMPKEAFADMWRTIKTGKTWRGFVKNLTKNGDYYWVYATISPIERADGFKGYTSIRQRMSIQEINREEKKLKALKS